MPSALNTLLIALAAAVALWIFARLLINWWAGLRGWLGVETGEVVRKSSWGTAEINGVTFFESVRVVQCRNGWLVQLHWLLGGGKVWLPRGKTQFKPPDQADKSRSDVATLLYHGRRVRLRGDLAQFIATPSAQSERKKVDKFLKRIE